MTGGGVAFAGNLTADRIKVIERLPRRSELAKILTQVNAVGGSVCNSGISLSILAPEIPIRAYGAVGEDADGERILALLKAHGIRTEGVARRGATSYTDVFFETETRARTMFHYCGANDTFDIGDIDFSSLDARIFHAAYLLLLARLDGPDAEFGTRMARLLSMARRRGCLTSLDVVSESGGRAALLAAPALRHTDLLTINEIEAESITGVPLLDARGRLSPAGAGEALRALMGAGVSRWAILHAPDGAYGLAPGGKLAYEPARRLPEGYIGGAVGAGDAFVAGVLLAAYRDLPLAEALRYGNASAMVSLRADTSIGSMCAIDEALRLYDAMPGNEP